jgi:hypothetical protein
MTGSQRRPMSMTAKQSIITKEVDDDKREGIGAHTCPKNCGLAIH